VSGTPGVITFNGITQGTTKGLYNTDWTRFQPRFAFAYQYDDKTVIRGGYGIYSFPPVTFGIIGLGYSPAGAGFGSPDDGLTPAFYLRDGFPNWPRGGDTSTLTDAFGAVQVGENPVTSPFFVKPDWQIGYSQSMTLSLQREIPGQILFEVAGIGNLGRHLTMGVNHNQLPRSLWGGSGNRQSLRPFPQFGSVDELKAPEGITNHWGFQLRLTKRLSHGLLFLSSYTWQKTLGVMGYEANDDHRLSRSAAVFFNESNGPSGSPFHLFKFSWAYDLPWGPGKPRLNSGPLAQILGGWSVGGLWSWYGGSPFSLVSPQDSLNCFCGAGSRLDPIGELNVSNPTIERWFNTEAVTPAPNGRVGLLGPATLVGPDFRNLDLSVSKTMQFAERFSLKFNWEIFNLTNTTKFGNPGTVLGDPGFGVVGGYRGIGNNGGFSIAPWYGARIMQLGLRLAW
jgi:hypothetical protein